MTKTTEVNGLGSNALLTLHEQLKAERSTVTGSIEDLKSILTTGTMKSAWQRIEAMDRLRSSRHYLDRVNISLGKLAAGNYGSCESCGTAIPFARLEKQPHCECCLGCANAAA